MREAVGLAVPPLNYAHIAILRPQMIVVTSVSVQRRRRLLQLIYTSKLRIANTDIGPCGYVLAARPTSTTSSSATSTGTGGAGIVGGGGRGLSSGQIAGIVIGSVIGGLLVSAH